MESKIVGKLKPHELDSNLYIGDKIEIPYFNNIKISVGISDANHPPTLMSADQTLKKFIELTSEDRIPDTKTIMHYYDACIKNGIAKPLNLSEESEIWKYVHPSEITIYSLMDEGFYLSISCGCDWEKEHGLELIFKDGKELIKAGRHG